MTIEQASIAAAAESDVLAALENLKVAMKLRIEATAVTEQTWSGHQAARKRQDDLEAAESEARLALNKAIKAAVAAEKVS
jgi:hypothetical protein